MQITQIMGSLAAHISNEQKPKQMFNGRLDSCKQDYGVLKTGYTESLKEELRKNHL